MSGPEESAVNTTLTSSLQRSLTIDVAGLASYLSATRTARPSALPHSHSASGAVVYSETTYAVSVDRFPDGNETGSAPEPVVVTAVDRHSPFSGAAVEASYVLGSFQTGQIISDQRPAQPGYAEVVGGDSYFGELSLQTTSLSTLNTASTSGCPPHGAKAVCGKRTKMEDAYVVLMNFFDLPSWHTGATEDKLPARIALQMTQPLAAPPSVLPFSSLGPLSTINSAPVNGTSSCDACDRDILHFFAVYDGHGGCEAAQHCASRLHLNLSEALAVVNSADLPAGAATATPCNGITCQPENSALSAESPARVQAGAGVACPASSQEHAAAACTGPNNNGSVSAHTDGQAAMGSACPGSHDRQHATSSDSNTSAQTGQERPSSSRSSCTSTPDPSSHSPVDNVSSLLQDALRDAFIKTDAEFAQDDSAAMVGSTAVVALLGRNKIWIANCGDSRAVMCRGGKVVQLTDDHKPEREDEAARVEKAGGQVLYWNGHRVMGVLAMSRAIGDHGLRPYVIPEPEITVVTRSEEDDFLLLATDGLWDVMANQEATNLAIRCMTRAWEKGASRKAAVRIAASVLIKAAIDRGSKDNVTVVIVDLKHAPATAVRMAAGAAASSGPAVATSVPLEPQPTVAAPSGAFSEPN